MLEEILDHIHNYFVVETHEGTFSISSKSIDLDFLQEGQYFKIVGSVFNDGVYQYPAEDLVDEEFKGKVLAMAIPPSVVAISSEIDEWCKTNPVSGLTSESFGGYSYTRGSGTNGAPIGWQAVFRDRLNKWRKIS